VFFRGRPVSTQESFTKVFPEGTQYVPFTAPSGSQTDAEPKTVVVNCEPIHQCGESSSTASVKDTASVTQEHPADCPHILLCDRGVPPRRL